MLWKFVGREIAWQTARQSHILHPAFIDSRAGVVRMKPICDNKRIVSLIADKWEVLAWWLESRRRIPPLLTDSPLFGLAERQGSQIDVKVAT